MELGKLIKNVIEKRFAERGEKMRLVEINIGYVLRCASPIPFDQEYTRDLGYNAVRYLLNPKNRKNAMITVDHGKLTPLTFEKMINPKTKKTEVRYVDVKSDSYKVARSYMVRLDKQDLNDAELIQKMAVNPAANGPILSRKSPAPAVVTASAVAAALTKYSSHCRRRVCAPSACAGSPTTTPTARSRSSARCS